MRIGIDYSAAIVRDRTGVGNYCFQLVDSLLKIDKENSFLLYPFFYNHFYPDFKNVEIPHIGNFKVAFKKLPLPVKLMHKIWFDMKSSALKEYMLGNVDVVHSTTFCAPKLKGKRKRLVVTIYDLTVLTHPECHTAENIRVCTKGINDTVKYADEIIAISEYTKQDILNILKVPEERVTVTHLAADSTYRQIKESETLERVRRVYKLPEKFVLFIGSLEPRKNIRTLIYAYARLPERFRKEFPLVIAGAKGWLNSDISQVVRDLHLEGKVLFPGFIDKEDISAIYSLATVFVYPSLYEGFGLPILEAMACATPVITSNTSSMPEVAGDAAKLICPNDVDGLTAALEDILDNEALRDEMRAKGLKRATNFSWDKCAKETIAVYKKSLANAKRDGR